MSPSRRAKLHLVLGPLFFVLVHAVPGAGLTPAMRSAFGLLLWMAWWWITGPVALAVTGFLPLVVVALFRPVPISQVLPAYAGPMIILLLGANVLAAAWQRWGLDRRIALVCLLAVGADRRRQILVWFAVAMVLSTVLPNTVVAAAMMPIVVAMLRYIGIDDLGASRFATAVGIAVAWGTSVGGAMTPLGGAPNLLTVGFIEESVTGREFLFTTWVSRLLPLNLVVMAAGLVFVRWALRPETDVAVAGRSYFKGELSRLGPTSVEERWALGLFAAAVLFAFGRPLYAAALPELHLAFAFLAFAILAFVVRCRGEALLEWDYAQSKMVWGLFYLFAGGAALGRILGETGAARYVAEALVPYATGGGFWAVAIFSLLTLAITQITSNTAAVAITVPITISTFQALGQNPLPFVYIVAVAGNCGLVLPSSAGGTAVAAGYGIHLRTMFQKGLVLMGLLWVLIFAVGYLLTVHWPAFGSG